MNSPYIGTFRVSQRYKGDAHDGMDLVGVTSKDIYSTVNGTVLKAGWENPKNTKQGFGIYVKIQEFNSNRVYYFGHLSSFIVKAGETVTVGQKIGVEGNTGKSTGSHCHYCCRINGDKTKHLNIADLIGIPNVEGTYTATQPEIQIITSEDNEMRYTYENLPDWAKPTIDKLISKGIVKKDNINLGEDALRVLVFNDRAGLYNRYYYLKEVPADYRPTIDRLISQGVIKGKGGVGEDLIIDLTEDAIRTIIYCDRMN